MDTDRDGEFSLSEWEDAIETALSNKLAQRAAAREAQRKAAAKEIAEFTGEFLNAARHCFEMIDKDGGGTLSTAEIVKAVKEDQVSNAASYDRAPFNLRGLRGLCDRPSRHHLLSTHRKSSHSSGPAARKICSSSSPRRASRRRWPSSTRTSPARLMSRSGRPRSRRASRTAWSSCRSNASAATAQMRERMRNSPRSSSARPVQFS